MQNDTKVSFQDKIKSNSGILFIGQKREGFRGSKTKKGHQSASIETVLKLDITTVEILYLLFDVIEVWGMNLGYK